MLHVWLRAQRSTLAVWHMDTKQWHGVDNWQALHDIYGIHGQQALCLYFPSHHLLQVDTELSAPQLKQLGLTGRQYLFEETTLAPVEQLAVRQIGDANHQSLYALAGGDVETWQHSAALAGLNIQALLPDFLLLPVPEEGAGQQVVLYQDSETDLIRQSLTHGFAVSYLPLMFERFPQLTEVCVLPSLNFSTDSSATASVSTKAIDTGFDDIAFDNDGSNNDATNDLNLIKTLAVSPTAHLNAQKSAQTAALIADHQLLVTQLTLLPTPIAYPERHALNFFVKSSHSKLSPYLRVAMMVALSALVLQIATDAVQWYRYDNAATATQMETAAQYQSWFPDETLSARTKLQAQIQPKLRTDSQASESYIATLSRIAPLIKQSDLQAQSLVMESSALSFTLVAADRSRLDEFAAMLTSQGLNANLQQVNNNEQGQFLGQIIVTTIADTAPKEPS